MRSSCLNYLDQMPQDFGGVDEIKDKVKKLSGAMPGVKGFSAPLNVFLFQEILLLQKVIDIVRKNLNNIVQAIDGNTIMTQELLNDLLAIHTARVPRSWTWSPTNSLISWMVPGLGSWFSGLKARAAMLQFWMDRDRSCVKSHWFAGFMNPQGFLASVQQEVTRQHKGESWALDDVCIVTEVLPYEYEKISIMSSFTAPEEGQNIHGLFMEGGRWKDGKIDEAEPKKLFFPMPVIHVSASAKRKGPTDHDRQSLYDCAVYRYPMRTDLHFIFRIQLKIEDHSAAHWKLRAVALLCQTE